MKNKIVILMIITLFSCSNALAHKRWILPSSTALSSTNSEWVTFDVSASNDVFYFYHGMPIDGIVATAPDGTSVSIENKHQGKLRSVFDIELKDAGTYRVGTTGAPMFFSRYTPEGKDKPVRIRAKTAEEIQKKIPKGVKSKITKSISRVETYITKGQPSKKILVPSKQGLELGEGFNPTEIYQGEVNRIPFLLNGAPAKGITIAITHEGSRFRDQLASELLITDDNGYIAYHWPQAGRYLIEAEMKVENPEGSVAQSNSYSYFLTIEAQLP